MLTSVFGISIKYEAWNHQDSLPVYIAGSYNFHTAYIGNRRCIMLTPTEELATLPALKKQITKIQQIDNVPVVFELTTVSNYRRKSLIENNIPFVTDKQVFLPFIGTMLSDEKEPQKLTGKFVYSTQQLFLFYLYSKKKRLYISEAGKVLPFTAMTLTRAVKQLETTDLFLVAKDGVNKFIESKYKRDELFEKAKVYLTTPVRKAGYIDKTQVTENMVFAGETALSEKTMLNPSRVVTYAISEKDYDKTLLTDELIDPDKQVRLELWAYNPKQFSEDNSADDISIVLSFGDTNDERIEEAVDELLKTGQLMVDGIPVLSPTCLIPFKAKAWMDLKERKLNGEQVDSKNIKKHKNDVFRLAQLITANTRQVLSPEIAEDMKKFLSEIADETVDLKSLGIRGTDKKKMTDMLYQCYGLKDNT